MMSIDIPNLPGMAPSADKWLYKQSDGFRKTKSSRPHTAGSSRNSSSNRFSTTQLNDFNGTQKEMIRPVSASSFRAPGTQAGMTPMMRATMSRPASAIARAKTMDSIPSGVHGAAIGTLGVEEEKVDHKFFATTSKIPSVPNFVEKDRVVTRFYGHFVEKRPWSRGPLGIPTGEENVVRYLTIIFHVNDQTIEMSERKMANSGMSGGAFCSRRRIKKLNDGQYVTIEDLAVGNVLMVLGQEIHITDADAFTYDYFRRELNIQLSRPLQKPESHVFTNGAQFATGQFSETTLLADKESAIHGDVRTRSSDYFAKKESLDKTSRFLKYEGQILRFQCILLPANAKETVVKETYQMKGDEKKIGLLFYLCDGSIEVRAIKGGNNSGDAASLVKRGKVAKNWRQVQRGATAEYYVPYDLLCGSVIDIYGKKLLLTNCNDYTKRVYEDMELEQKPVSLISKPRVAVSHRVPAQGDGFLNIGSPADTLATVYGKPKQVKDNMKIQRNQNRTLRCKLKYLLSTDSKHPGEANRVFMLTYYLEDDTLQIYEETVRNSGYGGGNFLKRGKYQNHLPDDDRYHSTTVSTCGGVPLADLDYASRNSGIRDFKATDIYIGNIISVNGHEMQITEMDNLSVRFCESYPEDFPMYDAIQVMSSRVIPHLVSNRENIRNIFTGNYDVAGAGHVDKKQFMQALEDTKIMNHLNDQEVLTLLRKFQFSPNGNKDYIYLYNEMCDMISHMYCLAYNSHGCQGDHQQVAELDPLFSILRKKSTPWRKILRRESSEWGSIGNYITLAQLLALFNKHGVHSKSTISDRDVDLIRQYYGVDAVTSKEILKKMYKNSKKAGVALKDPTHTPLASKFSASKGGSGLPMSPIKKDSRTAIRNRRELLMA